MYIRNAKLSDAEEVIAIINQGIEERANAFINPMNLEEGTRWFRSLYDAAIKLIVIERDNHVVGWASLTSYRLGRPALRSTAEVTFYVSQENRNQGVASKLIREIEEQAVQLNLAHLVAILLDDNLPSKTLLKKIGYKVWANFEQIVHFPDHSCGHLYMGKHIIQPN